jgi:hypothetical protein
MIVIMVIRVRELVGPAGRPCALCGGHRVVLVHSWDRPGMGDRVRARLGAALHRNERFTDECRDCGARASVRQVLDPAATRTTGAAGS